MTSFTPRPIYPRISGRLHSPPVVKGNISGPAENRTYNFGFRGFFDAAQTERVNKYFDVVSRHRILQKSVLEGHCEDVIASECDTRPTNSRGHRFVVKQ